MVKKIKKKTKIKFIPILLLLLLLIVGFFLVSFFMNVKIKNIYIYNNNILSDQEIIELSDLEDYPSFIKTSSSKIEKKLLNNQYIKDVKVDKSLIATISIRVVEYDFLFEKLSDGKIVVDVDKEIIKDEKIINVPILVNYVPDTVYDEFITEMKNVDSNIRCKISNIEYSPNDYDKERFLLYMNDGNKVFVTLTKDKKTMKSRFSLINKYDEIYPSFGGKKGTLNLDSGNHFDIEG